MYCGCNKAEEVSERARNVADIKTSRDFWQDNGDAKSLIAIHHYSSSSLTIVFHVSGG
jgi:hypothetical protein